MLAHVATEWVVLTLRRYRQRRLLVELRWRLLRWGWQLLLKGMALLLVG